MAHDSMNQVICEEATLGKNVRNTRKWGSDHGRDSHQQQSKRTKVVRPHATRAGNKKAYAGNLPYYNKCKWHHIRPCTVKCGNLTCFGCGAQGHFKSKCPRLKNQNHDNQKGKEEKTRKKSKPLNFKRTEGVVGLTRWFEKIETVFYISNCPQKYQVKYASCTLQDNALTWWNSHKRTIGTDAAYAMTWKALIKLMTKMVPEEEDQVEKFIGGLPDNIQGNVVVTELTRLQDAIRIANNLMDQKLKGYTARDAENKRRLDSNPRDNRVQQPPLKRQNVARAYTMWKLQEGWPPSKRLLGLYYDDMIWMWRKRTHQEVAFDLLRDALSVIFGLSELKSSDDDNDDDDVKKDEEDEEEEEHLASADPSVVPTDDPVPQVGSDGNLILISLLLHHPPLSRHIICRLRSNSDNTDVYLITTPRPPLLRNALDFAATLPSLIPPPRGID
ncbi:putative reverse transcriptase domain-containing protein [Tanacetum coccineum]